MVDDLSQISAERLKDLRESIHSFLQQSSVYTSIRDIVDTYIADHPKESLDPVSSTDVMKIIREKGVVQDLLNRMRNEKRLGFYSKPEISNNWKLLPGEYYLHVRLAGGKAFVDNLDLSPNAAKEYQMHIALHFGSQRFRSVTDGASVDPLFNDEFLLSLDYKSFGSCATDLIEISTPLHIAVIREDRKLSNAKLLGENVADWRRVLRTGYLGLTVELCGENPGVPAGILELQLELLPSKAPRFSEEEVANRIDLQRSAITSSDREFLLYARRWWAEYQEIRPSHRQRRVKVFASTSNGRMVPTTHFVSVIRSERGIETPMDAARFVSLLVVTDEEHLTQEVLLDGTSGRKSPNNWLSMFIFLCQKRGEASNHAALLCSLLLGFGLDAYCAVGANKSGETTMFVVTRKRVSSSDAAAFEVTFWEPVTGNRYAPTGAHPFESIGCIFNHRSFYANIQISDATVTTSFDLDNEQLWKPMNPLKLRMVPKYPNPSLLWIPCDSKSLEVQLETDLMREIAEYRDTRGIVTSFDDGLAYVLPQALATYEGHRRNGSTKNISFFESCVKGVIGEGKTFKGVPMNVTHLNSRKIMTAFVGSSSGREILELMADSTTHAVKVKVYPFPEGVLSVWVMLAAAYKFTPLH